MRRQIEAGELPRGAKLPTIMELANTYEIAPVTVRKGLDMLKREGLIHGVSGYGTFVTER